MEAQELTELMEKIDIGVDSVIKERNELRKEKEKLQYQLATKEAQILAMQCCGNCAHENAGWTTYGPCYGKDETGKCKGTWQPKER